jgi:hypothetical protein
MKRRVDTGPCLSERQGSLVRCNAKRKATAASLLLPATAHWRAASQLARAPSVPQRHRMSHGSLRAATGWTVWPETASALAESAADLPNTLLLQDPDLQWGDVLPAARRLASLYGTRLRALPYAIEVPLMLYRR